VRDRTSRYLAYLLRMWQVRNEGRIGWRASVENVHTGERRGFASLGELFTFLENEAGQIAKGQPTPDAGDSGSDIETLS
jgi:hypothetical protein